MLSTVRAVYNKQTGTGNYVVTSKMSEFLTQYLMGLLHFFYHLLEKYTFFEKYLRIKIENRKILVLMSIAKIG